MKAFQFLLLLSILTPAGGLSAQEKSAHKSPPARSGDAGPPAASPGVAAGEATADSQLNDEPGQMAANFFGMLEKGRVDDAYAGLTHGSKIASRPEEMKSLKAKTTDALEMFGSILGYDQVESKSVGPHVLRRTYLSLGKEFPLRWRFYFYRAENRWRLIDLRVDDRLVGIFDEADDSHPDAAPK